METHDGDIVCSCRLRPGPVRFLSLALPLRGESRILWASTGAAELVPSWPQARQMPLGASGSASQAANWLFHCTFVERAYVFPL